MGGTCVNVGCGQWDQRIKYIAKVTDLDYFHLVPSKFLIQAARIGSPHNSRPPYHGFSNVSDRVADFSALTRQNRGLVESLREKKYANVIAPWHNVEYVTGAGKILRKEGGHFTIAVYGTRGDEKPQRELLADRVILATGVGTRLPENLLQDLGRLPYLTNETAYFEPVLPESLIILGGGYVAVEAAQMFARLGSRVTLLQRSSHILSGTDEAIAVALAGYMEEDGIEVVVGHDTLSVAPLDDKVVVTTKHNGQCRSFETSKLFLATGRSAKTENVSDIPIHLSDSSHAGFIVSDTLQTSVSGVYAAGDCIAGSPQYVYTAAAEGKLAALNAIGSFGGQKEGQIDYSVVPWVVFSSPAIAGVGLDLTEAQAKGIDAEASTVPLSLLPRAIVQLETRGFVTLIRDKRDDTIIGARILAEDGGELVMEASLCVQYKIKAQDVGKMFHPYLTWNEVWKLAALGFAKDVNQLSCCAT